MPTMTINRALNVVSNELSDKDIKGTEIKQALNVLYAIYDCLSYDGLIEMERAVAERLQE